MKKRTIILFAVAIILTGQMFADVVKKTKSEVNFKKLGKFTSIQTAKISELIKATDSDNTFKGKGLLGKLAGKFALKSGQTGEIIDLPGMLIYELNHKKKEYRMNPIETISNEGGEGESDVEEGYEEEEASESDVRIIRNEFKVDDTGEKKTINQFPSQKYNISWVMDWENVRTSEKGTNRLLTEVWTTPLAGNVKDCQEQEMLFSREHMKRIGIDMDSIQQDILGTNWLAILTQMSEDGEKPQHDVPDVAKEMKKIKGYPVIVEGKYYATKQGGEEEEEEEEAGGLKKKLGGFAKKALKKSKKKDDTEPTFSYFTELIEFRTDKVGEDTFQVPTNYKKKG